MMRLVVLCVILLVIPELKVVSASSTSATSTVTTTSTTPTVTTTTTPTTTATTTPAPITSKAMIASPTSATSTTTTKVTSASSTSATATTKSTSASSTSATATTKSTSASSTSATATTKGAAASSGTNTSEPAAPTTDAPTSNNTGNGTGPPDSVPTSANDVTSSKPEDCGSNPCGNSASCLQLSDKYVCQCPLNYAYNKNSSACEGGDFFLGEFILKAEKFDPDPSSPGYTKLYNHVLNLSEVSLQNLPGYLGTNIVRISLVTSKSKTRSRRSTGDVSAKVSHVFQQGSGVTITEVTEAIRNNFTNYSNSSICDGFYCDPETTDCAATPDGLAATCTCQDGKYTSVVTPVTSCRDCAPECYQAEGTYCDLESGTIGTCACRSGYKNDGDYKCKKCDFGYSGVDCADDFELILVIVGAVLGAVIVALLGAIIGVAISSKKKPKYDDRAALIDELDKTHTEASPAPVRLFPKVQAKTDVGQANKSGNVYEDDEEFNRNLPKRDYDENQWLEMNRRSRNY